MADYVSVLSKAVDGLSENTVEARAEMYSKAQDALQRQLDALGDAMTAEQVEAQLTSLKEAVAEVEALHAPVPTPDELLAAGLQDALGSVVPDDPSPDAETENSDEADEGGDEPLDETADLDTDLDGAETASDETVVNATDDAPVSSDDQSTEGEAEAEPADAAAMVVEDLPDDVEAESAAADKVETAAEESEPDVEETTGESVQADADSVADGEADVAEDSIVEDTDVSDVTDTQATDAEIEGSSEDAAEQATDEAATEQPDDTGGVVETLEALADDADDDDLKDLTDDPVEDAVADEILEPEPDTDPETAADEALTSTDDSKGEIAAGAAAAAVALGSIRPDSTVTFAAKSRLDEAFGKAESKFSKPRPLAGEGDPMSRVQSAVAELEAEAERSNQKTSEVISLAEARSNARPDDAANAGNEDFDPTVADAPAMENVADAANDTVPRMEDLRVEPIEIPTNGAGSKAWMVWLVVVFIVAGGGAWMYLNRDAVLPTLQSMTEQVRSIEDQTAPAEDPKIDDRVPAAGSGSETETTDAPAEVETQAVETAEAPVATDGEVPAPVAEGEATEGTPGAEVAASGAEAANAPELPLPPIGSEYALLYEEGAAQGAADLRYGGGIIWSVVQEPGADGNQETVLQARTTKPMNGLSMSIFLRKNTDATLPASHTIEILFAVPDDAAYGKIGNIGGILLKESEPERGQPLIGAAAPVTDGFFIVGLSDLEQDLAVNLELLRDRSWFDIPVLFESGKRGIFTLAKGESGAAAFEQAFAAWGEGG